MDEGKEVEAAGMRGGRIDVLDEARGAVLVKGSRGVDVWSLRAACRAVIVSLLVFLQVVMTGKPFGIDI